MNLRAQKRRYDIPLNKDPVAVFQIQLTSIMLALCVWALAGFLSLQGLSDYWVSGLSNNVTVELSPLTKEGQIIESEVLDLRATTIAEGLQGISGIETTEILARDDVSELIGTWLDTSDTALPLPVLISVDLNVPFKKIKNDMHQAVTATHENFIMNTHKDWVSDFLQTAYFMKYMSLAIFCLMGIALFLSVRGIIKARMAAYAKDIELLHLIGASDHYIAKQFQKHATSIAIKGVQIGALASLIGLLIAYIYISASDILPQSVSLSITHLVVLCCIPLACLALSALTARKTALETLNKLT